MDGYNIPSGIFSHSNMPEEGDVLEGVSVMREKTEVIIDMMPGAGQMPGRFKRAAKGGGGRLPNRNG